jgi:hypothetical protein
VTIRLSTRAPTFIVGSVLACATTLGVAFHATDASADDTGPKAEVMVVHATHCPKEKKHIDPRIGQVASVGYECMDLLDKKVLALQPNKTSSAPLPNGRIFYLQYLGRQGDKYKLTASFNLPDGGPGPMKLADVAAELNKPFNVGGLSHAEGVLILTVKVIP